MPLREDVGRGRRVGAAVIRAFQDPGIFGHTEMPEAELPPGVTRGSEAHLRFITLVVSIDYLRDAHVLWRVAREAYADPRFVYLFDPDSVARTQVAQVGQILGIALQPAGLRDGLEVAADGVTSHPHLTRDRPAALPEPVQPDHFLQSVHIDPPGTHLPLRGL